MRYRGENFVEKFVNDGSNKIRNDGWRLTEMAGSLLRELPRLCF
jgi:hypothetical protein